MDLIDRQEAIKAVTYAMRNGGDWRPALEAVERKLTININSKPPKQLVIVKCNQLLNAKDLMIETDKLNSQTGNAVLILPAYMDYVTTVDGEATFDVIVQEIRKGIKR